MDDARSGTLMFMSRRIHGLTIERDYYEKHKREYEQNCKELAAMDDDHPRKPLDLRHCESMKM